MEDWLLHLREQLRLLPLNLSNHLLVTVIALATGAAISLPLGMFVARRQMWRYPTLTVVSLIQTIPSLALLALMVPMLAMLGVFTSWALGFQLSALGFWPTVIALTLYSMLPMVRNTVVGLLGVDPAVREAALGMGMTARQMRWRVELPLALPVILAGIRTATVWVVGIATLSTPVGQRSLGNFIFRGLQTRNWTMVLVGCVCAAALAIWLDLLLGGLERASATRKKVLGWTCGLLLVFIFVAGLSGPALVNVFSSGQQAWSDQAAKMGESNGVKPTVRIGAKTFTEQYILASLIEQHLQQAGYPTRRLESLGSTVVFDALASDQIDVYVDYSGTLWANVLKRQGSGERTQVIETVTWYLAQQMGIRCLGPLGFENAYALAMRRDLAERKNIRTLADLAGHSGTMRIGGDYEFFGRPEWRALRHGYQLSFRETVSFDATFMYQAAAQNEVEVIAAFSSDGRIAAYDLVTIEDPLQVIPPYDAVLLVGPTAAQDEALCNTLRQLLGGIDIAGMREANHRVDRDENKQTIRQAAGWLLHKATEGIRQLR